MKRYIKSSTGEYALNDELNGIEIKFDGKPSQDILDTLKANGFRWHNKKRLWYAKQSPDRLELAQQYATEVDSFEDDNTASTQRREPVEPQNQFGVKVGDMFVIEWGYEQTNLNFFQVVSLAGKSSVRVIEVNPDIKTQKATGPMSEDISFKIPDRILPAKSNSVFIKDQQNGDLKRLTDYGSGPCFTVGSSHQIADLYHGETLEESWYY